MASTKAFQKVAVYGRHRADRIADTLTQLIQLLEKAKVEIVIEAGTAQELGPFPYPTVNYELLGKDCDLVIVVGGDGSLLHAAHSVIHYNTPILGINRGRLGFLTDILPQEMPRKIQAILNGEFREEPRFALETWIQHDNQRRDRSISLNDVVLLPGQFAHMIAFDIYVDRAPVCEQRADGLIISTPTGSTAYALSGGGPIMHPGVKGIVLVPMFPHTLSSRPIVVDCDSALSITIRPENETSPHISCDGRERIAIHPGETLNIRKHHELLRLVHPIDYDYFETLRDKLGWQTIRM